MPVQASKLACEALNQTFLGSFAMDHSDFANEILDTLREPPVEIPSIETEETRRNNAARCMAQLFCNRLSVVDGPSLSLFASQTAAGWPCFALRSHGPLQSLQNFI